MSLLKTAFAVAGGEEVGTGWRGGRCEGEGGFAGGVPQREQDGGRCSLGVTGNIVDQQCRTDFCAPKYARDSFNLTITVESGFLVDVLSGASRGYGSSFCLIAVGLVGE